VRRPGIRAAALAFLAFSLAACAAEPPEYVRGLVPNESGFDGAVTVAAEDGDDRFGHVTVNIPYRSVTGEPKTGQGRIAVRRDDMASGKPLPAFCHVHYEKDVGGAKKWCRRGWAVATAHYGNGDGEYPIDVSVGDGYNLARALIQWVRRLPFIDRTRLHIDGASQGGYMALAMSADCFPVTSATADCPVVNWAYNLSYFEANRAVSKWPQEDVRDSPLPVLCAVTMLVDWSFEVFDGDLGADTWFHVSPISRLDRIAHPVLVVCATGDMLVPMEQMTRDHLRPHNEAAFPEGYRRGFDELTLCEPARRTFEELLPEADVHIEHMPLQDHSFELTLGHFTGDEKKPGKRPKNQDRPWSKTHQWSLCYLDEGPPTPYASHTSHEWATSPDSFVAHYQTARPAPAILTASKLDHLMRRYTGKLDGLPALADGRPANRLNFPLVEQFDVLTGLLDYAGLGDAHAARLRTLYRGLECRPFGNELDLAELRKRQRPLYNAMSGDSR